MPVLEPVVQSAQPFTLRHVGPQGQVWSAPNVKIQTFGVLNQPAMVARPLTARETGSSAEFASGSITWLLDDSGSFTLTFPNSPSLQPKDGPPWRQRFDPGQQGLRNQWIEIYQGGGLEFVGQIEQVQIDSQQVIVSGHDAMFHLKNAYERDWTCVQAPRDVIERGTKVWMPAAVDNFPAGSLGAQWTAQHTGTGFVGLQPNGGLKMSGNPGDTATLLGSVVTVSATSTWRATCSTTFLGLNTSDPLLFSVTESNGDAYYIGVFQDHAVFETTVGTPLYRVPINGSAPGVSVLLESDGEWVWAFVNGQLVGVIRRNHTSTTTLQTTLKLAPSAGPESAFIGSVKTVVLQPFVM